MERREEKIFSHEYDGIREYDNPLPGWWVGMFYATIVWAVLYALFYHLGPGLLSAEAHEHEMGALTLARARSALQSGDPDDEAITAVGAAAGFRAHAARLFQDRCQDCHGARGEGGLGPNLTDAYWIHGGSPSEIQATIAGGIHDAGMPAWSWSLRPDEIWALAAFVDGDLRGSAPAGAKAPEGLPWRPGTPSASRREQLTATLGAVLADGSAVARGRASYLARCLACHGPSGEGLVGPNLTDDHYLHGAELPELFAVIAEGVPEKGMIAWKNQLGRAELQELTAYVASLRGTRAPGGKAPEGEPWTSAPGR